MNFQKYVEEVKTLNFPQGQYAIIGGGPLAIREIRDAHDIDLIVTPELYEVCWTQEDWQEILSEYKTHYLKKGNVELWTRLGPLEGRTIQNFIDRAELIQELPFVNLQDFLFWKRIAGRGKDKQDVKLTEELLRNY